MPLRALLKESTRAEHEGLERLLALDSPRVTRERYGSFLQCAHAFHAALEPGFDAEPLQRWGLDMRARSKRRWLERDLDHLGLSPIAAAAPDGPCDDATLLGRAYVVEGATLGGRVLLDGISQRCGVRPGAGACYLAGYAEATGRMWKSFVAALEGARLTALEEARCVEGARAAFRHYAMLARGRLA